jgi:NAD(P)-dependent dehydrogenase (short-subunit alcohol dehydrogenase family)
MSKTILVTGGSRGIGRAVCLIAAKRGWSIAVNYRQERTAAEAVVAEANRAGAKAIAIPGDVAREDDVVRMSSTPALSRRPPA